MHEIGIETQDTEAIRIGKKTIEVRLGKPDDLNIKEGDIINVREDIYKNGKKIGSHDDSLSLIVTQILYFESFNELFQSVDFEQVNPFVNSTDQAIERCYRFYSKDDEEKYGVVAIFFDVKD